MGANDVHTQHLSSYRSPLAAGLRAGAAGTTALNLVTYLDMATRGRPASSSPAQLVSRLAQAVGVDLGDDKHAAARSEGVGALLGIYTGLAAGVAGSFLVRRRRPGFVVTAATLGAGTMLASDTPVVAMGLTDPRKWSAIDWLSDVVPHAVYGATTAACLR